MGWRLEPIGFVRGGRSEPIDDDWGEVRATIALDPAKFGPAALAGLDAFSHAEIVFLFDQVKEEEIERGSRRPRGRPDWPLVGLCERDLGGGGDLVHLTSSPS